MCSVLTDKELSQQAKDYFAQIRKTDRLIQRLKGTVATLRSGLTSQNYELKPDKVQSSGAKNPLESTMIKNFLTLNGRSPPGLMNLPPCGMIPSA